MSRLQRQRRRRRSKGGPGRPIALTLGLLVIVAGIAGIGVAGWVVSVANSGPSLNTLRPQPQSALSFVYAADGKTLLGTITAHDIVRQPIASSEIPQVLRDATVAVEDRRFFDHKGVDYEGLVRAAVKNIESKNSNSQGGSTLTMQLIRNLYTGDDTRSGIEGYKRKIREAKLAEELEDRHPGREGKNWILNKYMNNVPYGTVGGQTAVGVQAAARTFFGKPASKVTLAEAALIAGLPQAPSRYNPFLNKELAKARRDDVLQRMADQGYITQERAAEAIASPVKVTNAQYYSRKRESHFFDYVKTQLIKEYGLDRVEKGGMRIYTTLDLKLQDAARKALEGNLGGADRSGAIVSINPANGEIRAMASSASYAQSKFNLASQGKYAAGSTFKTMVLMEALRQGVSPTATTYTSMPLKFDDPEWGPIDVHTYSGSYIGRANLVRATLTSDNSIYQQLDLDVGPENVKQAAIDMGIKTHLDGLPAEGLGGLTIGVSPLEMANAYATIASGGWRNKVTAVRRVCFPADGGKFDCEDVGVHRHKAFPDGITYEVTKILEQNVTGGTGTAAQIGCPAAGKTGTTDDFTDAWFVGYTPRLSTSVWVGHAKGRTTLGPGAAGGTTAAPIWGKYMKTAKGGFCGEFQKPKQPFVAKPFFGKYAKAGVKGNKAEQNYNVDKNGDRDLEQGKKKKDGGGTKAPDGSGATPSQPQTQTGTPGTQTPGTQTPGTQTPADPAGGAAPPANVTPSAEPGGTGAPPA